MLFNSFEYFLFFIFSFFFYWFLLGNSIRLQNLFLLVISYVFYGWWDWRFLGLIFFSSWVDYVCAIQIEQRPKFRKLFISISLLVNLSLLGFFKYFNFFIDSFQQFVTLLGLHVNPTSLHIILPVGISFYTFQTMSYTIDVYRRELKACHNPINFFAYVSFFPQLVAGPIERAQKLLPQFEIKRVFSYTEATAGLRLILWGLVKKMVIADNCAVVVNNIFSQYQQLSAPELLAGAFFFAFQIYGDFSGYSDIARGSAKLLGFELMVNFKTPYFSRDIAEFWRRWHISLSTWFRDYVYIPLGGSKVSRWKAVRNIIVVFVISGFWHGANWTFVIWGLLNGLFFMPLFLADANRKNIETVAKGNYIPGIKDFISILYTFCLVTFAWIFFRASSVSQASQYISLIADLNNWKPYFVFANTELIFLIAGFVLLEWAGRDHDNWLSLVAPKWYRYIVYILTLVLIVWWGVFDNPIEFIYFQF